MSPLNQKDILAAAKAAGKVIPVQIYLFSHYDEKYGYYFTTSKQLEDLVKSLDPKLVKVVGRLACCWLLQLESYVPAAATLQLSWWHMHAYSATHNSSIAESTLSPGITIHMVTAQGT